MTLRDSLQSEITALEADLAAKRAEFSTLEGTAAAFLDQEAEAIKAFVVGAWAHIFGTSQVLASADAPAAPAAATAEQTGVTS